VGGEASQRDTAESGKPTMMREDEDDDSDHELAVDIQTGNMDLRIVDPGLVSGLCPSMW
jgi:hypothetical protein